MATLVLLAGTATVTGIASADRQERSVDTATGATAQQQTDNATESLNVTVETLELQNVEFRNVHVDHVHVIGNVTSENVTTEGAVPNVTGETRLLENVTAKRLFVVNATLQDVTLRDATLRNETVRSALLGNGTTAQTGNVTVENATLRNVTVDGFVVNHGTVNQAELVTVRIQGAETVKESVNVTANITDPAIESEHLMVGTATVDDVTAVAMTVENTTGGPTPAEETPTEGGTRGNESTNEVDGS